MAELFVQECILVLFEGIDFISVDDTMEYEREFIR